MGAPVTLVGASTVNGLEALMSLDGALNAASFAVYREQAWRKLKTALRTAMARTREAVDQAVDQALAWITRQDAQNWFDHCGYHVHQV